MMYPHSGSRMLNPTLTVAPTKPLLSMDEISVHLRVDSAFDADYLTTLLYVATSMLDGWNGLLGLALLTQTWTVAWDSFPWQVWRGEERASLLGWPVSGASVIRLPLAPIQSVVLTYYDANNVQQTLSSSLYGLYRDGQGWFISLNINQNWPVTYQRPDAVTVTMVCGYGATADSVPLPIRHAAKMLMTNWYENRSAVGTVTTEIDALLNLYKRNWVH